MSKRRSNHNGSQNKPEDPFFQELKTAAAKLAHELTTGSKSLTEKHREAIIESMKTTVANQYEDYSNTTAIHSTANIRTIVVDKTRPSSDEDQAAVVGVQRKNMGKTLFKVRNDVNQIISSATTAANNR